MTNISGRGVGMDVVKKNIESLRGSVVLHSEKGKGTTVKIHLPLTLSIIDGFMFKVNQSAYVVPLDIVIECTEATREELYSKDGGNYLNLRGNVIPVVNVRQRFGLKVSKITDNTRIIVVGINEKLVGLLVDEVYQVIRIPLSNIDSPTNLIEGVSAEFISGVGRLKDRLIILLNLEHMLFPFEDE